MEELLVMLTLEVLILQITKKLTLENMAARSPLGHRIQKHTLNAESCLQPVLLFVYLVQLGLFKILKKGNSFLKPGSTLLVQWTRLCFFSLDSNIEMGCHAWKANILILKY